MAAAQISVEPRPTLTHRPVPPPAFERPRRPRQTASPLCGTPRLGPAALGNETLLLATRPARVGTPPAAGGGGKACE